MNVFARACGVSEPLHLQVGEEERQVPRPFVLIGRDPRADVVCDERDVRRLHAYIQAINGHLFCVGLAGTESFRWEDGRPGSAGWLDRHQAIRIGSLALRPGKGGSERLAAPKGQADSRNALSVEFPGPPAVLEVALNSSNGVAGAAAGGSVRLVGRMLSLVGRAPECAVVLPHPSVSTFHCALLWTTAGLWVIDLLGQGGITVNGVRVRSARLADGDEWGLGHYSIRVRFDDQFRTRPAPGGVLASDVVVAAPPALAYAPSLGPGAFSRTEDARSTSPLNFPLVRTRTTVAESSEAAALPATSFDGETTLSEWNPAENEVLLSSMMIMMNQFGLLQQRKLDQFLRSMMGKIQASTSMIRDEQAAIRTELDSLRGLAEDFGRVKAELSSLRSLLNARTSLTALSPPSSASPASNGVAPTGSNDAEAPDQLGDFYVWLSRRVETLQDEHQTLWRKIMNSVTGRHSNENVAP